MKSANDAFWDGGGLYRSSDHPVGALFARQRIDFLRRRGLLDGVSTLLDVGAGNGLSSRYYPPEISVTSCDYAAGMLDGNPATQRVRCSAKALPFANGSFDITLALTRPSERRTLRFSPGHLRRLVGRAGGSTAFTSAAAPSSPT